MNIPFLGKKIKWYNMSDLNETELKKGFFRPNQKFCTDDSKRSNIVVDHLWKVDFAQELEPSVGYE